MKLQKEIVEILSNRYQMFVKISPAGLGRSAFINVMTQAEEDFKGGHCLKVSNLVEVLNRDGKTTVIKIDTDGFSDFFQSGDKIVLYDGGMWRNFWSVGYWKAHVYFQSMTWDDLRNWKPLKEGEYEELSALVPQKRFFIFSKVQNFFLSK